MIEKVTSFYDELINLIYNYSLSILTDTLEHITLGILFYTIICFILYYLIFRHYGRLSIKSVRLPNNCRRVLLVIAHPDDECMFFGPTLLALQKENCRIFLLCLSIGNYNNLGHVRREELYESCKKLNINMSDITTLNLTNLQDDPHVEWNVDIIASLISKQIETLDIELLITFDKDGVSHHQNHCAIYYATASLYLAGAIPKSIFLTLIFLSNLLTLYFFILACRVFILESVNLFRKYMSILDLPITLLLSTNW